MRVDRHIVKSSIMRTPSPPSRQHAPAKREPRVADPRAMEEVEGRALAPEALVVRAARVAMAAAVLVDLVEVGAREKLENSSPTSARARARARPAEEERDLEVDQRGPPVGAHDDVLPLAQIEVDDAALVEGAHDPLEMLI